MLFFINCLALIGLMNLLLTYSLTFFNFTESISTERNVMYVKLVYQCKSEKNLFDRKLKK